MVVMSKVVNQEDPWDKLIVKSFIQKFTEIIEKCSSFMQTVKNVIHGQQNLINRKTGPQFPGPTGW